MATDTYKIVIDQQLKGTGAKDAKRGMIDLDKAVDTAKAGLIVFGAAAAASFAKVVMLGSDASEEMSKFGVVFEGVTGGADAAIGTFDSLAESLGRNKFELRAAGSAFGDLFQPLGFAADEALGLSEVMTGLAVDLSSFNNMPMDEALTRLQGTLVGSHENALAFGVVINESVLKQELAAMGADKLTGSLLEQAKVQARINLLLAGTTAAQGDAIRTSDGFANQVRSMKDALTEAATELGTKVVPILADEMAPVLETLKDETIPELVSVAEDFGPAFADAMAAASEGLTKFLRLINSDSIKNGIKTLDFLWKFTAPGMARELRKVVTRVTGLNQELMETQRAARSARMGLEEATEATRDLDRSQRDIAAGSRAGRAAMLDIGSATEETTDAIEEQTESVTGLTDEIVRLRAGSIESAEATQRMADAHEQFAPAANAATGSIEDEINALDGLFEGFEKINTSISGGFITALDQTDGKMTSLQDATANLDGFILNLAASSGATAGEMALLAAATGEYSQAAIDAAVAQIEFEVRLETIRQRFADGSISVYQMRDAVRDLVNEMNGLQDKTVTVTLNTVENGQMVTNNTSNGAGLQEFGDGEMPSGSRAGGGPVIGGQRYNINESGMESFIAPMTGFILDADQTAAQQGNTSTTNIYVSGAEATALILDSFEMDSESLTVLD